MAQVRYEVKHLPTRILDQSEIVEIVDSFRKGDFSLSEKFILHHSRVAISVAVNLRADTEAMLSEMASEALLQLCRIPQEVFEGKLLDYGLTPYTISRVKTCCLNFMRSDRVFKIPAMTGWRTGKRANRLLNPARRYGFSSDSDNFMFYYSCRNLALVYGLIDVATIENDKARELLNEIMKCVKTEGERIVIGLRAQEHTDKEIAKILGTSLTYVVKIRKTVEERFLEKRRLESE